MDVLTESDIVSLLRVDNYKSYIDGNGYTSFPSNYDYIQAASTCIKQISDVLYVYVLSSKNLNNNDSYNPQSFHCSLDTIHVITKNVYYQLEGRDLSPSIGFTQWSSNRLNYNVREMRHVQKCSYSFDVLEREWTLIHEFMQRTSRTCNAYQQNQIYITTLDQMFRSLEQKTHQIKEQNALELQQKQEQKRIKQHKDKIIVQLQEEIEEQKEMIKQLTIQNERLTKLYKGCQIVLSASYHKGVKRQKRKSKKIHKKNST